MTLPLPLLKVHHLAVTTKNRDQSVAFYRDVLGFQEVERPGFNFQGAWMVGCGIQIHIIQSENAKGPVDSYIDSRANHTAFAVEDSSTVTEILDEHGIAYRQQVNAGGIHQTFFQDPDGHHIEVAVYPPNPPLIEA
ncbi:MAG: VOC family protein [Pirellulales bacterium]